MKTTSALLTAILLISLPVQAEITIKEYPDMFIKNNRLDVKIVVGDNAMASDTIGAIEIATSLQVNPTTKKALIGAKAALASEIEDIKNENLIVVGGACANGVAAELMGYPPICYESIPPNTGIIRLYKFSGGISLVAAGRTAVDTRRVCRVLANYYDYKLPQSDYMEIINTNEREITIR
jgi:hypothetical protein